MSLYVKIQIIFKGDGSATHAFISDPLGFDMDTSDTVLIRV